MMTVADLKCSESNNSFAVSFTRVNLRRERKEDCMEVGESEVGLGFQDS